MFNVVLSRVNCFLYENFSCHASEYIPIPLFAVLFFLRMMMFLRIRVEIAFIIINNTSILISVPRNKSFYLILIDSHCVYNLFSNPFFRWDHKVSINSKDSSRQTWTQS